MKMCINTFQSYSFHTFLLTYVHVNFHHNNQVDVAYNFLFCNNVTSKSKLKCFSSSNLLSYLWMMCAKTSIRFYRMPSLTPLSLNFYAHNIKINKLSRDLMEIAARGEKGEKILLIRFFSC